jgi:hypothetical protein
MQGMKSLCSMLDVKTDRIYHSVSASKRTRDRLSIVNIRFNRLKLRIIKSKQPSTPIRVPCCNPNRKPTLAEMPNDAAAEKPGSAEHGDGALVHDHHGSTSLSQSGPAQSLMITPRPVFQELNDRDLSYKLIGGLDMRMARYRHRWSNRDAVCCSA